MRLIIVRHGETEDNVNSIVQGHRQGKLTENGMKQAKRLAERLETEQIDAIFCSDLERAKDTVKEIARFHKTPIIYMKELRERSLGIYEGGSRDVMKKGFEEKGYFGTIIDPDFRPEGGESYLEFNERATKFLRKILKEFENKTVLVCSHGGFNRMLIGQSLKLGTEELLKIKQSNACVNILVFEDGKITAEAINDTHHID